MSALVASLLLENPHPHLRRDGRDTQPRCDARVRGGRPRGPVGARRRPGRPPPRQPIGRRSGAIPTGTPTAGQCPTCRSPAIRCCRSSQRCKAKTAPSTAQRDSEHHRARRSWRRSTRPHKEILELDSSASMRALKDLLEDVGSTDAQPLRYQLVAIGSWSLKRVLLISVVWIAGLIGVMVWQFPS
jgi:hypothetical protein